MKKILAMSALFLTISSVLAGCGADIGNDSDNGSYYEDHDYGYGNDDRHTSREESRADRDESRVTDDLRDREDDMADDASDRVKDAIDGAGDAANDVIDGVENAGKDVIDGITGKKDETSSTAAKTTD